MELEPEDPMEGLTDEGDKNSERAFKVLLFVVLIAAVAMFVIPWYMN